MEDILISTGLSKLQAQTYLYLLQNGPAMPNALTLKLQITRTNTYKVLESLERLGLVTKEREAKKATYVAEDPVALTELIAEKRNSILALEQNVDTAMQELRRNYTRTRQGTELKSGNGKAAIAEAYKRQAAGRQPVYFVKSRADVPFMGFEVMDSIRRTQGNLVRARYGITHDSTEAPYNPTIDKRTRLTRTWVDEATYTAPVEWSASGDNLLIQVFDGEGRVIIIEDAVVAAAFRQLWSLLDASIRHAPDYPMRPIKAKRVA